MRQVAVFIDEGVRIALEAKADLATMAALEAGGKKPPSTDHCNQFEGITVTCPLKLVRLVCRVVPVPCVNSPKESQCFPPVTSRHTRSSS